MRAIILASGMGTRLRPLTNDIPKSLVNVNGEAMTERQIRFLKQKGIDDIIVTTGYKAEKFEYLKEKYGVTLIHNHKYKEYNNIYTMYLVRDYLKDAFVTEGDVYMMRNYFETNHINSTYYTGFKSGFKNEWIFQYSKNGRVDDIIIGDGSGYIMSGVSYWNDKDGAFIKEKLEEAIKNRNLKELYWDDIVKENLSNLNVYLNKIDSNDWYEIDSVNDYNKLINILEEKNI